MRLCPRSRLSYKHGSRHLPALPCVQVALVGAPNVGKSSLVQVLSSGLPEVCDYPFTTRTIKMGHFYVEGRRHQITDTPGLLNRSAAGISGLLVPRHEAFGGVFCWPGRRRQPYLLHIQGCGHARH